MNRRRLVSTIRVPAPERLDGYNAAWERLRGAAEALGAHAWRFRSASDPRQYIEFLEFRDGGDPRAVPDVADLLDRLDQLAAGDSSEWVDTS